MNRRMTLAIAAAIAALTLTPAAVASAATPTPVGPVRAHHAPPNTFYVCLWENANNTTNGWDGPFTYDTQALHACLVNKPLHPIARGTVWLVGHTP